MKRFLIRDVDLAKEGPGVGCILEYDDEGNLSREIKLSEQELTLELNSDRWSKSADTSWIGKGIQRWKHEEKI